MRGAVAVQRILFVSLEVCLIFRRVSSADGDDDCVDRNERWVAHGTSCSRMAKLCKDEGYGRLVRSWCPRTCGLCGPAAEEDVPVPSVFTRRRSNFTARAVLATTTSVAPHSNVTTHTNMTTIPSLTLEENYPIYASFITTTAVATQSTKASLHSANRSSFTITASLGPTTIIRLRPVSNTTTDNVTEPCDASDNATCAAAAAADDGVAVYVLAASEISNTTHVDEMRDTTELESGVGPETEAMLEYDVHFADDPAVSQTRVLPQAPPSPLGEFIVGFPSPERTPVRVSQGVNESDLSWKPSVAVAARGQRPFSFELTIPVTKSNQTKEPVPLLYPPVADISDQDLDDWADSLGSSFPSGETIALAIKLAETSNWTTSNVTTNRLPKRLAHLAEKVLPIVPSSTAITEHGQRACPLGFQQMQGHVYGNDHFTGRWRSHAESAKECGQRCLRTPACGSFEFSVSKGICLRHTQTHATHAEERCGGFILCRRAPCPSFKTEASCVGPSVGAGFYSSDLRLQPGSYCIWVDGACQAPMACTHSDCFLPDGGLPGMVLPPSKTLWISRASLLSTMAPGTFPR